MLLMKRIKLNIHWMKTRYGSGRGFLMMYWHGLRNRFGAYDKHKHVDWKDIKRVVFICKGNICRSAFAERVARKVGVEVISCGINAIVDGPANREAVRIAKQMGYDLSVHRTTPIMYPIFLKSDLLVVMEPEQSDIVKYYLTKAHHITLLGLWGKPERPFIYDPYGTTPEYFRSCFNFIEKSVYAIADKIRKED